MDTGEEKKAKTWYVLIRDAIRQRLITVIVAFGFGAVSGIYTTILTVQPQLISVTSKVAAIEDKYVTKDQFDAFAEKQETNIEGLEKSIDRLIDALRK